MTSFFGQTWVKVAGIVLGAVCTALLAAFPPPHQIGWYANMVLGLLVSLGIYSGGLPKAQPPAVLMTVAQAGFGPPIPPKVAKP
jgi:hypothetical protein